MSERRPNHPEKIGSDQDFLNSPRGSERFWQRLHWKRATVMGASYLILFGIGAGLIGTLEIVGLFPTSFHKKWPEAAAFAVGASALISATWLPPSKSLREDIQTPFLVALRSNFSFRRR